MDVQLNSLKNDCDIPANNVFPKPVAFSSICVDCGGIRGPSSFAFTCAQCSSSCGFQTTHCARCLVQFHDGHSTYPLRWPEWSNHGLALRFLALVKMSKEVKSGDHDLLYSDSSSPDSNALPDISNLLPKRN